MGLITVVATVVWWCELVSRPGPELEWDSWESEGHKAPEG